MMRGIPFTELVIVVVKKSFFCCLCLFLVLLMGMRVSHAAELARYFAQLAYNHVSPHVQIRGVHELTAAEAARTPHYRFGYDTRGQLVEIVRMHPESWKQHPLTHMGKVKRIVFTYSPGQEERLYFDENGAPMRNIRGVFREVYEYSPEGFRIGLRFYDEAGKPMNSAWNIARYTWERKGDFVVERHYDVDGSPRPISSYFPFLTVGIRYGDDGIPTGTYNLDDTGTHVINNRMGIASYRDVYDREGKHVSWAYFDAAGQPVMSPKYHKAVKTYNPRGDVTNIDYLGPTENLLFTEQFSYPD